MVALPALAFIAAWAPALAVPDKARYVRREASVVTSAGQIVSPGQGHVDEFAVLRANITGNGTAEEHGEEFANVTTNSTGRVSTCSLTGDPHILTFDRGPMWHSLFGEGHWWLVRTSGNKVAIQAYYGKCGLKTGPGWMRIGRTCIMGVFVGGTFLRTKDGADHRLIVRPPCDWAYHHMRCRTHQKFPRVLWSTSTETGTKSHTIKGSWSRSGVSVRFTHGGHIMHASFPWGVKVKLHFAGPWAPSRANQYINAYITMQQGVAGAQCGHCGNFNGNPRDDQLYNTRGALKSGGGGLCDPKVPCREQMAWQEGMGCSESRVFLEEQERELAASANALRHCKGALRENAIKACIAAFHRKGEMIKNWVEHEECKACVIDQCLGGGFMRADAQAAKDTPK